MATWLPHLKLQFGGPIGEPIMEQWSCTVRFKVSDQDNMFIPSNEIGAGELDQALAALVTPLRSWFNAPAARISERARLTFAKLNQITATGGQRDVATHRIEIPEIRGNIATDVPWFVTQALTMRTATPRGRGHSGRIFPPLVVPSPVAQSPYTTDASVNNMAQEWAGALNAISAAIRSVPAIAALGHAVYPVIASAQALSGPNPGGALLQRVLGVVVDKVPDVQHRRTNAIPRLEGVRAAVNGAD